MGLKEFTGFARSLPGVRTVAIHHGTKGDPWVPGMSDIDLALSVEDGGVGFLERFHAGYRDLRRRWPFLQEVVIATPAEWKAMAANPISAFEVAKCEGIWGDPLPATVESDRRAKLIRALSLWTEHGPAMPRPGAFGRAFDARLMRKVGDLESECRAYLESAEYASQPEAKVKVLNPAPVTEGGLVDPFRNGFFRKLDLGPWGLRFWREVKDCFASPVPPKTGILADWAAWERARMPYVLRLLAADPQRLYTGYMQHQTRRARGLDLLAREGVLASSHEALPPDPVWKDWKTDLETGLRQCGAAGN